MNKIIQIPDDVPLELFVGNCIGAFTRALNDKIDNAIRQVTGLSTSACCGIVQIGSEPGSTIEFLRRILNLDHSTVVRLLDRLQKYDLIERVRNNPNDRREVNVFLTDAGEAVFSKILKARRNVLQSVIKDVSYEDQLQVVSLIERLMPRVVEPGDDQHVVCRLCELEACRQDCCPVNKAWSEFYEDLDQPFRRKVDSIHCQEDADSSFIGMAVGAKEG